MQQIACLKNFFPFRSEFERKKKLVFCYGKANDCLAKAARNKEEKILPEVKRESEWSGKSLQLAFYRFSAPRQNECNIQVKS
jgi:hypothetical protein